MGIERLFRSGNAREKVERVKRYFDANRADAVKKAAAGICSVQTLRNLVKSIENPNVDPAQSTTFKNGNLDRVLARLAPIEFVLHHEAYQGYLAQLGFNVASQETVRSIAGTYALIHRVDDFPLTKIRVMVNERPFFPTFAGYVIFDRKDKSKHFLHDGFVISAEENMILFGLSEVCITNINIQPLIIDDEHREYALSNVAEHEYNKIGEALGAIKAFSGTIEIFDNIKKKNSISELYMFEMPPGISQKSMLPLTNGYQPRLLAGRT